MARVDAGSTLSFAPPDLEGGVAWGVKRTLALDWRGALKASDRRSAGFRNTRDNTIVRCSDIEDSRRGRVRSSFKWPLMYAGIPTSVSGGFPDLGWGASCFGLRGLGRGSAAIVGVEDAVLCALRTKREVGLGGELGRMGAVFSLSVKRGTIVG